MNKEVSCLKWIFNRAIRHGKLEHNPVNGVKTLPEKNFRMRILTQDEFDLLLEKCDKRLQHLRAVIAMGYYMGMPQSKILYLTWPEVDLKKGFIRLSADRTKTNSLRVIPIHPKVKAILEKLLRGLHTIRVFLRHEKPFNEIKSSFQSACNQAGIEDFTFHDLRHCALNNFRLAGNDYFKIMSMSGHKTMSVFKRYSLVTEEELSRIKWPEESRVTGMLEINMDTAEKKRG